MSSLNFSRTLRLRSSVIICANPVVTQISTLFLQSVGNCIYVETVLNYNDGRLCSSALYSLPQLFIGLNLVTETEIFLVLEFYTA